MMAPASRGTTIKIPPVEIICARLLFCKKNLAFNRFVGLSAFSRTSRGIAEIRPKGAKKPRLSNLRQKVRSAHFLTNNGFFPQFLPLVKKVRTRGETGTEGMNGRKTRF
jgi:hypothetical protein